MELSKLVQALKSTGLPVAYGATKKGTQAPFLVYMGRGTDRMFADNTIYSAFDNYDIEYYFEDKSPEVEKTIEETLLANGLIYEKGDDVNIEDSDLYYITYSI